MQITIAAIEDTTCLHESIMDIVRVFHNSVYDEGIIVIPFKFKILLPIPLILNRLNANYILLRLNYHHFNRVGLWHIDTTSQSNIPQNIGNSKNLFNTFLDNVNNLLNGALLHNFLVYLHQKYGSDFTLTDEEFSSIITSMLFDDQIYDLQLDIISDATQNLNDYLSYLQEMCSL